MKLTSARRDESKWRALSTSAATLVAVLVLLLCLSSLHHDAFAQNKSSHKAAFLSPHNAARAEVAVANLTWNATLATYARRYAARRAAEDCKLVHSRGPYGENIFWGSAHGGGRDEWAAADAVASWVKEKASYDCESNRCAARRKCGHYTQVVWAGTKRLGCAAVECGDGGGTFIICSYDPPGNVDGKPPYPGCGRDSIV
ncbi:hypothetical protein HU200_010071 [Digitaria exilis]|uniref:SCP domain-containing protein n=1 Tax=Digitaria exilis TaxID=1010633 RepID=A0A835FIS3_9POAL|nr:hypothetical protein HU200_010071 [Digitaria exilis]